MTTGLRILHCLRAPVGGLFRHVCDLAEAQSRAGYEVAIVCADTGNTLTSARLDALAATVSLGVHRTPMGREMGLGDVQATRQVEMLARALSIDVLHGHGAKGGAYARLATRLLRFRFAAPLCIYTPHGGSLHFDRASLKGRVLFALERRLEAATDAIVFESAYSAERYASQVGAPKTRVQIIPNGVGPRDFEPVAPNADATDFLFVGELRALKGVDVLLDALAVVAASRRITLTVVGDGPDAAAFKARSLSLGITELVRFPGAMPAREAFKRGQTLIVPSRAESFPYIVLEAGAAAMPLITTRVGGIPEIIGDTGAPMLAPGDVAALARALSDALARPGAGVARATALQARVNERFTIQGMSDAVLAAYRACGHRDITATAIGTAHGASV